MIETLEQSHSAEIMELKREIVALENKLSIEKAATDAERRKNHAMSEQQQNIEDNERLSPSTSTEEDSVNTIDSIWPVITIRNNYLIFLNKVLTNFIFFLFFFLCFSYIILLLKTNLKAMQ